MYFQFWTSFFFPDEMIILIHTWWVSIIQKYLLEYGVVNVWLLILTFKLKSLHLKKYCMPKKIKNAACQKKLRNLCFPPPHTKPHNMNMNAHSDLQEHWEALFPYSTQRGVAKFVDSAQLNPWLNPAWYPYGKVIMISPASWVIWSTKKKKESWQQFCSSTKQITKTCFKWKLDLCCGKSLGYFSSVNMAYFTSNQYFFLKNT
jgi:hypothetical protein